MKGITFNPYQQNDNPITLDVAPEVTTYWENTHKPKMEPFSATPKEEPIKVNTPQLGYLDGKAPKVSTVSSSVTPNPVPSQVIGSSETRALITQELDKRGITGPQRDFLLKSAQLESGMQLDPKNHPTGVHRGGKYKGKQFTARGAWQILDTNLAGLPHKTVDEYMANVGTQLDNVLEMYKQGNNWLRSSGYLEKGMQKGYTEDELMYLMHHGWTGAVKAMVDEGKSIGDVVNGPDKGTAYTLGKYRSLKLG